MRLNAVRFLALFFTALALGPALAHLLELPNKIGLSGEHYLAVQQIYRGWSLLGVVVAGALLSTATLAVFVRGRRETFVLTLVALLAIAGTQVIFWTFTFPVNQATNDWSVLPPNWAELRRQWEYSHAAGAVLNLAALTALILSVLRRDE